MVSKTCNSNNFNKSKDNYLWNKCEEGEREEDVDKYIPPSWDTNEDVPQEK